jgi:sec-independent protein translocase protein TatB
VFDVGFSELMVIAVVALIVIGPERLPRVARTMGHLFGRLQRYVNDVKADINREIELDELRKFKSTFEDAARGFEGTVNTTVDSVQSEVSKTETELNDLTRIEDTAAAPPGAPQPAPADAASQPGEAGHEPQGGAPPPSEKTAV